jgi:hypothetical protein
MNCPSTSDRKASCYKNLSFIAILKSQIIFSLKDVISDAWAVGVDKKKRKERRHNCNLNVFKRNLNNIFALNAESHYLNGF